MIKKIAVLLFVLFYVLNNGIAFAQGEIGSAEQKLQEIEKTLEEIRSTPDLVSPDSIYTATMIKALYYQNTEIIQLLKEIRELLRQSLEEKEEEER